MTACKNLWTIIVATLTLGLLIAPGVRAQEAPAPPEPSAQTTVTTVTTVTPAAEVVPAEEEEAEEATPEEPEPVEEPPPPTAAERFMALPRFGASVFGQPAPTPIERPEAEDQGEAPGEEEAPAETAPAPQAPAPRSVEPLPGGEAAH